MGRGTRYDDEFKRNAVEHWIHSGKTVRDAAYALGVSTETLRRWKKELIAEDGPVRDSLEEENRKLRRENDELRQEREILKKSVAIFLKPQR